MTLQSSSEPFTSNGNGAARPLVRGASLVHRTKLTKSQRAVIVANIDDGVIAYQPSQSELAKALGVSLPMVQKAKRLSPLARQQVMGGKVTIGHFAKPAAPKAVSNTIALNPVNSAEFNVDDDAVLRAIILRRGVDHVVDMAAAVEAAQ